MDEQLALGDCPNAAIPVPEGLHDPGVTGPGFKPEMDLQRGDRDHAFDRAVRAYEAKRHAAAVGEHLWFNFDGFMGSQRATVLSALAGFLHTRSGLSIGLVI